MLQQTNTVEAYRMKGQTFDCGSNQEFAPFYIMGLITRRLVRHLKRLSKSFNDQRETLMKVAVFDKPCIQVLWRHC